MLLVTSAACADERPRSVLAATSEPRASAPPPVEPRPDVAPVWPAPGAPLTPPALETLVVPAGGSRKAERRIKVYVDAGHGAPGNTGARSAFCSSEADFTLDLAEDLSRRLRETGRFEVKQSRTRPKGNAKPLQPRYQSRVKEAQAWGADVLISLHFDVRGSPVAWQPTGTGAWCWRNDETPGFSVLISDDAEEPLLGRRRALARAVAEGMSQTGFLAYDGWDYTGLYDADETPGVFIDRRPPGSRVYLLRRPKVPSIIIETHHALDIAEATRWREVRTREAFAQSVAAALVTTVSGWR